MITFSGVLDFELGSRRESFEEYGREQSPLVTQSNQTGSSMALQYHGIVEGYRLRLLLQKYYLKQFMTLLDILLTSY